jgi:hypothetical protein
VRLWSGHPAAPEKEAAGDRIDESPSGCDATIEGGDPRYFCLAPAADVGQVNDSSCKGAPSAASPGGAMLGHLVAAHPAPVVDLD